jgi:hypothetical protein
LVSDIPALNALCRICSPHEPTSINLLLKSFSILTGCLFPLPFCSHRWLENVKVCQRALDILSDFNSFVDAVEAKKVKNPDTKSFDIVNKIGRDKFTKARLQF